ncbi:MAG: hypothetical protein ACRDZV_12175, partial [Acidimicrobiia bacterium]
INILSGLQRNGAIVEEPPGGTFSFQVYQTGSSGIWLAAVAQGGLPADRVWWPMTLAQDAAVNGGNVVVGALLVDADAQTAAGFQLLDSHLILLHLFLGYSSHVATGLDPRLFQVNAIRKDATHFYILGQELDPPVDPAVGEPSYLAGDLATLRTHRSYTRIARVPLAQLTTVASWQFWSGTAWVAGLANAARLVDVDGTPVNGPGCIHLTPDGRWIFAAMALGDTHLDVYDADAPQGPWRRHARVPVPTAGKPAEGGIEVGWHTKIVGHLAAPAEHSIVSLTMAVLNLAGTGQGINIRRTCPQHVAIPWY